MPKRRIVDIEKEYEAKLEEKDKRFAELSGILEEHEKISFKVIEQNRLLRNYLTPEQKKQIAELGRSFESEGESNGE